MLLVGHDRAVVLPTRITVCSSIDTVADLVRLLEIVRYAIVSDRGHRLDDGGDVRICSRHSVDETKDS